MAEYIVTVAEGVDWRSVHNDLIRDTSTDDSVDSNIVPDRVCECTLERPNSNRNTHYELTDQEAEQLKNDPRILSVQSATRNFEVDLNFEYSGLFNRDFDSINNGERHDNWGLLRHTNLNVREGADVVNVGQGTYNYVLDGTGVDVVIMDTGIQPDHPEFEDANGISRVKQIDWYAASGIPNPGVSMSNHYTDSNGHGTHVASTVAGKTFGWGKNAHIYSMKIDITSETNHTNSITQYPDANGNTAFDVLRLWHQNKGTGRPTVINMSWGTRLPVGKTSNPVTVVGIDIQGVYYRGVDYQGTNSLNDLTRKGFHAREWSCPFRWYEYDAELDDLINTGAHVCIAAGNNGFKIDDPSGPDYNNFVYDGPTAASSGADSRAYYGQGSSPFSSKAINVGSLSILRTSGAGRGTQDFKVNFSSTGPGVDLYCAGDHIIGAVPNGQGRQYYHNTSYRQDKYSGTSMASPQMCGMISLLLQVHPDWSPAQVKEYFLANAGTDMDKFYSDPTNTSIEYNSDNFDVDVVNHPQLWENWASLNNGANRVAYFPLHGNKPYGFNSSS